jgi:hypothetical protein
MERLFWLGVALDVCIASPPVLVDGVVRRKL